MCIKPSESAHKELALVGLTFFSLCKTCALRGHHPFLYEENMNFILLVQEICDY